MEKPAVAVDLDDYDRKILTVLREDGRITVTDLAQRIGLSKTPCQQRLKRLIEHRVIIGFTALIDPAKLALDHVAFTEVKLSDTRENLTRVDDILRSAMSWDVMGGVARRS